MEKANVFKVSQTRFPDMSRKASGSSENAPKHSGINSALPVRNCDELPIGWRCVNETNIEKRLNSSFDTWKFDIQCQVASMGRKLDKLTKEYDLDDLNGLAVRTPEKDLEHEKLAAVMAEHYKQQGIVIGGGGIGMGLAKN